MTATPELSVEAGLSGLQAWGPVVLRALLVLALATAGAQKVLQYDAQLAAFQSYGVPAAATMVLVVGAVELLAAVAFATGVFSRTAAVVTLVVMANAVAFAGPAPSNLLVVLASLGVLALGPGQLALWDPEAMVLGGLR